MFTIKYLYLLRGHLGIFSEIKARNDIHTHKILGHYFKSQGKDGLFNQSVSMAQFGMI